MATTFRRVSSEITEVNPSGQIVYTVPAGTTTLGLSLLISYVGTGTTAFVSAQVSGTDGEAFLVKEGEVQSNSSLELIANKLVVASGDALILGASSLDSLAATFSYLELT